MTALYKLSLPKTIAILVIFVFTVIFSIKTYAKTTATPSGTKTGPAMQRLDAGKDTIESKILTSREKMASREAEVKAKLDKFKNKEKAGVAKRINNSLITVSQKHLSSMKNHLSRLLEVLSKLEARIEQNSPEIKDSVGAKSAIEAAKAKIALVSSKISEISENDYTIAVSTESRLKADAQKSRDNLREDLQELRELLNSAKQSVIFAIKTAKAENSVKEATPSGQ